METFLKVVSYTWAVLRTLIFIGVAAACLQIANGRFERIVVALLAMIYIQITSLFATVARGLAELLMNTEFSSIEIRKLLNDQKVFDYIPEDNEIYQALNNAKFQRIVFILGNWVVYVIILIYIFETL